MLLMCVHVMLVKVIICVYVFRNVGTYNKVSCRSYTITLDTFECL